MTFYCSLSGKINKKFLHIFVKKNKNWTYRNYFFQKILFITLTRLVYINALFNSIFCSFRIIFLLHKKQIAVRFSFSNLDKLRFIRQLVLSRKIQGLTLFACFNRNAMLSNGGFQSCRIFRKPKTSFYRLFLFKNKPLSY